MDRVIEKTKTQRLIKHWPYVAGGIVILIIIAWLVFGNHASTLRVDKDELTISEVKSAEFKDYGDVIVRLSNSNLDLQILNAEAELAEKQNLLRNTQVAMQQDRLNNQTEQAQLDMDTQRKQRTRFEAPEAGLHLSLSADGPDGGQPPEHA